MDPFLMVIIVFVAKEVLKYHIKQIWGINILPFLFPRKSYRLKLENLIIETISEFKRKFPKNIEQGKIQFFEDKDVFSKLTLLVLFKKGEKRVLVSDFENKPSVEKPSKEEIDFFYSYLIKKISTDVKLKNIYINEKYKEEIFNLAQDLEKLIIIAGEIMEDTKKIVNNTSLLLSTSGTLKEGIDAILERFGSSIEVTNQIGFAKTEIQPLADNVTNRAATVLKYSKLFDSKKYIAINGSVSTGKTQFAILISKYLNISTFWIGLREFDSRNYILKILYDLSTLLALKSNNKIDQVIDEVLNKIPSNVLIILDDLPKLDGRTKTDELFILFINKCIKKEICILSTSNYEIPVNIKHLLPKDDLEYTTIPFFSEDEIKELLLSYGANEEISELLKGICYFISSGHPTIVNAIGRYLNQNGWKFTEEELIGLFKGDYSSELTVETYENIIRTIHNEKTRELLYRLNFIVGNFSLNEVLKVSEINPIIDLPIEKFHSVLGLWIQKNSTNDYTLSPLIKHLKVNNLTDKLSQSIYFTLGKEILDKKKLNQFESSKAISYFINAHAYNDAGFVLIIVLNESIKNPELFFAWGFNLFWYKQELPDKMDLYLQMYIRILHLMLEKQQDEDVEFLKNDLERIVEKASRKGINIGLAALLLSALYATENPSKSGYYFILGIRSFTELKKIEVLDKSYFSDFSPEQIFWSAAIAIKSKSEIENWFSIFGQLNSKQREEALKAESIHFGCSIIGKNIISQEEQKEDSERNWHLVLDILEYIQYQATEFHIDLLIANAIRYRINILSEKLNKIDDAFSLFLNSNSSLSINPVSNFLIKDAIGRQLFYHGKKIEAMEYVAEAVTIDLDEFYTEKLDTYLVMSQLLGEKDNNSAHYFSEEAVRFIKSSQFFTETTHAKVIGEYAISLALNGKVKDAIYSLQEGYQILLDSYDNSIEHKIAILRYGHVLNYWNQIINTGFPPEKDGLGEPYQPPSRGVFLEIEKPQIVEKFYFEERRYMVSVIFHRCFEQQDDFVLAKKWAFNCISLNSDLKFNSFHPLLALVIPYLVIDYKYDDALKLEMKILESTNILIERPELLDICANNELLANLIKDRPLTPKIENADEIIVFRVVIPMILNSLSNYFDKKEQALQNVQNVVEVLNRWLYIFKNKEAIQIIIELLKDVEKATPYNEILSKSNTNQGELTQSIKVIGYIIASLHATTIDALKLHLALIQGLETTSKQISLSMYKLIFLPFFDSFWINLYSQRKTDFSFHEFWEVKSLPYYQDASWDIKIRKLFKILCHHLNYSPSYKEENWLNI